MNKKSVCDPKSKKNLERKKHFEKKIAFYERITDPKDRNLHQLAINSSILGALYMEILIWQRLSLMDERLPQQKIRSC